VSELSGSFVILYALAVGSLVVSQLTTNRAQNLIASHKKTSPQAETIPIKKKARNRLAFISSSQLAIIAALH
jgi:hypothetical protein